MSRSSLIKKEYLYKLKLLLLHRLSLYTRTLTNYITKTFIHLSNIVDLAIYDVWLLAKFIFFTFFI